MSVSVYGKANKRTKKRRGGVASNFVICDFMNCFEPYPHTINTSPSPAATHLQRRHTTCHSKRSRNRRQNRRQSLNDKFPSLTLTHNTQVFFRLHKLKQERAQTARTSHTPSAPILNHFYASSQRGLILTLDSDRLHRRQCLHQCCQSQVCCQSQSCCHHQPQHPCCWR